MLTSSSGVPAGPMSRKGSKKFASIHREFSGASEVSTTMSFSSAGGYDRNDSTPTPRTITKSRPRVLDLFTRENPTLSVSQENQEDTLTSQSDAGETAYTDLETDVATVIERASTESANDEETEKLIEFLSEAGFGFNFLLDRLKQNMHSCKVR